MPIVHPSISADCQWFTSESCRPLPCRALFMRNPGFGSNEAAALNAPRAVVLRAHFADGETFFAHFASDCLPAAGHELSSRRRERLSHRPSAGIRGGDLRLRSCNLGSSRLRGTNGNLDGLRRRKRWCGRRSSCWHGRWWESCPRTRPTDATCGNVDRPEEFTPILRHAARPPLWPEEKYFSAL